MVSASPAVPLVALVAAAGVGSRMAQSTASQSTGSASSVPKQYLSLSGKPVLMRSIEAMAAVSGVERVVVVLHPEDIHWQDLDLTALSADVPVVTVTGGDTRASSVLAGLEHILDTQADAESSGNVHVLVHDAARPLVRPQRVERLIGQILNEKACGGLLATPASDTLKLANTDGEVEKTLDRNLVWQAQTPQLFSARDLYAAIKKAQAAELPVTDEASAMEYAGFRPLLVAGDNDNIKLTHAVDIPLAEILLRAQESE